MQVTYLFSPKKNVIFPQTKQLQQANDSVRFFHLLKFHSTEHDEYITLDDQQQLYTTINLDNLKNTNQILLN